MSTSKSALSIVFVRKVVRVVDSEIVIVLRKTSNKDERRKIIKGYLIEKLVVIPFLKNMRTDILR